MLLSITTTQRPATDLGYLLHKHPGRFQSFELSFGRAHVFYPEASADRCRACLLLDVDPVGMVRGKGQAEGLLDQYVNDRPYVASSFLSVALSQVFGAALQGRCKDRPELASSPLPLEARLHVLPVRGGEQFLRAMFEPLGYAVDALRHPLDERFPAWGESPYFSVTIRKKARLSELLTHLYVLVPVFDNTKHYFVGDDELEKLLAKGSGWLAVHPEREEISRRYLKFQPSLYREALARLVREEQPSEAEGSGKDQVDAAEEVLERPLSLHEQRIGAVLAALRASGAKRVLDLGCGEGKLLRELLKDKQFEEIVGMDVSFRTLETARDRLKLDRLPERQAARIKLLHGSLIYRDRRLEGFAAAAVVEVVEHLDPFRLSAFERVVFEFAHPGTVVLTTPNREYNVTWENVGTDKLRHPDHRFEWTRDEFRAWAERVAGRHGYSVRFQAIGPVDELLGSPTQMAVFGHGEPDGDELVEAVIFVGLQGAGKSTFCKERFFETHLRLSLDLLKTRHREKLFLRGCVESGLRFVVDNTNPTRAERQVYMQQAKAAGFRVVGYYFQSRVEDCKRRNEERPAARQVPLRGILGTAGRMELPSPGEGFDELHYVRIGEDGGFVVEDWQDADR